MPPESSGPWAQEGGLGVLLHAQPGEMIHGRPKGHLTGELLNLQGLCRPEKSLHRQAGINIFERIYPSPLPFLPCRQNLRVGTRFCIGHSLKTRRLRPKPSPGIDTGEAEENSTTSWLFRSSNSSCPAFWLASLKAKSHTYS